MFGKKGTSSNTTIIGRGARFVGTLDLEGAAVIEGECDGTVRSKGTLAVGPSGSVSGELRGKTVSIAGRVRGSIVAEETLHVVSSGAIEGEVFYGRLQVDPGGVIDGESHQGAPAHGAGASMPALGGDVAAPLEEHSGVMKATAGTVSAFPPAGGPRRSSVPGAR